MNWSSIGAFALALAVALGEFGAHGLRGRLDGYSMSIYERAVFYHFIHAIGILVAPLLLGQQAAGRVCLLLVLGILLFCGSLYLLAITGTRALGAVTPLGGIAFIAAWICLGIALLHRG